MSSYLLIESRDPFESNDVAHVYELAQALKKEGHEVTLFLTQNGVLSAREGAQPAGLAAVAAAGVTVLADAFALKERGIAAERMVKGLTAAPVDTVIDKLADGCKAIWH